MLARAFFDDPVQEWLFPAERTRLRRAGALFRSSVLLTAGRRGEVLTTDGLHGAAVWAAPGRWRQGAGDLARSLHLVLPAMRLRALPGLRFLQTIEHAHPDDAPHWYLAVLGTDPVHQGRGVGSALLAPVLERCDAEGVPAYLESSKERNIPFYRRHGFEVTSTITHRDAPPVWGMWREPRAG